MPSATCSVPASNFAGSVPKRISSIETDGDHVPAAEERRHRLEDLRAAVQHADAGRAVDLVAGPDVEVGVDLADVDRDLRDRLRAVDADDRTGGVRARDDVGDRVDRAGGVRDVADRDELDRAGREMAVEIVELKDALVVDADDLEVRADLLAEHVPRHEVRVMLHLRHDDGVAGADVRAPPRVRDEVHGLGRVLREDRRAGGPVQPRRDAVARALEELRRLGRQRIDAAMDGAAMVLVVVVHRVEHGLLRLRRRGRVEVDGPLALKRREARRQRRVGDRAHAGVANSSRMPAYPSASSRSTSSGPPSVAIRPSNMIETFVGVTMCRMRW